MKKRIYALLMTMVLTLCMSTTVLAETNSPTGDIQSQVEDDKFDVTWSETESCTIILENVSDNDSGYFYEYGIEVYKDGAYVDRDYCWAEEGEEVAFDISYLISANGEGEYKIIAEVWADNFMGSWFLAGSGESVPKTFTKASEKIAKPTNVSFDLETGELKFDAVEGAAAYDIWYSEKVPGQDVYRYRRDRIESADTSDYDSSWFLESVELLKENYKTSDIVVTIGVTAVSEDIFKFADSDIAEVVIFEYKLPKELLKEKLETALENGDDGLRDVVDETLKGVSKESIIEMMETDEELAELIKTVDEHFIENLPLYKGVTSKTELVDAEEVEVVGAAINGRWASTVEFVFAEPEDVVEVEEKYENAVALDIELLIDGTAREKLDVPVMITMPIPTGVGKESIVILHYHGDDTEPAVITPVINEDGTMTFGVDGFSTFVVANEVVEETPVPTPNPTPTPEPEPNPEVPDTGDASETSFVWCVVLLVAGGVLVMKRNSYMS